MLAPCWLVATKYEKSQSRGESKKFERRVEFSANSIYLKQSSKLYTRHCKGKEGEEKAAESYFNKKSPVIKQQQQQQQLRGGTQLSSAIVSNLTRGLREDDAQASPSSCFARHLPKPEQQQSKSRGPKARSRFRSPPENSNEGAESKRKRSKIVGGRVADVGRVVVVGATSITTTTNTTTNTGQVAPYATCETSKCDSPQESRQIASSPLAAAASCLLWPPLFYLLALWLLLWAFSSATMRVSGLQQLASGQSGSEELSRAVLATMSTQSPVAQQQQMAARGRTGDDLLGTNASFSSPVSSLQSGLINTGHDLQVAAAAAAAAGEMGNEMGVTTNTGLVVEADIFEKILQFGRIFIMGAIIVGDICGNSLVILSVCRHSKLRVTTNWFVVSLACADILVALFAMTFNASVIISGRWLFKPWVCDFWNSCDVLASTASILHLCCISIDRYIAIMRPLDYPMKITTRRVVYALCGVWISSALLSYIPIFTGIYTTAEHIQWLKENPDQCEFVVNRVYAIVSSSISFWIPCFIMIFTYYRIYREAARQEKFIYKAQSMMPAPIQTNHHHHHSSNHNSKSNQRPKQRRSKSVAVPTGSGRHHQSGTKHHLKPTIATTDLNSSGSIQAISKQQLESSQQQQTGDCRAASMLQLGGNTANPLTETEPLAAKSGELRPSQQQGAEGNGQQQQPQSRVVVAFDEKPEVGSLEEEEEEDPVDDSNSGQSTPTKRSISKMKREHKAAKTLGIIMGVFILCWFPFFSWYTPMHICGHACDGIVPRGAVTILFWIGYFNSTLNPIIYAYFNHEFRDAFKKTLQWIFCCCQDLKCLRVNRPNDNQHYNCTYRSTQEIGLVSNS